jgi:ABC-2 type transport system permease protein
MTSTIYDLGYQTYAGLRHGRWHAFKTLFAFSLKQAFGIGRGEAARRVPIIVFALVFAPAFVQIGVAAATTMREFIHYSNYLEVTAILVALFSAAQAPELLVTDKSNGALTLYLSRPIKASDYALAKLAALTVALIILTLAPQITLFGGKILLAKELWPALKGEYLKLWPIVVGSVVVSLYFASVALALSAFAVRRAYASAAVIAFFLLTPALMAVIRSVTVGDLRRWAILISPVNLVTGFSSWLFEVEASRRTAVGRADLPGQAYLWILILVILTGTLVLLSRYRRNEA